MWWMATTLLILKYESLFNPTNKSWMALSWNEKTTGNCLSPSSCAMSGIPSSAEMLPYLSIHVVGQWCHACSSHPWWTCSSSNTQMLKFNMHENKMAVDYTHTPSGTQQCDLHLHMYNFKCKFTVRILCHSSWRSLYPPDECDRGCSGRRNCRNLWLWGLAWAWVSSVRARGTSGGSCSF